MTVSECPREHEIVDAVASGRWPDRIGQELRSHVATCAICADVAVVAAAMQADRDGAWNAVQVPPAGRVWWRAEMRARHEAARKASQPITVAQGLAGACAAGLVIALIEIVWLQFPQSIDIVDAAQHLLESSQLQLSSVATSMPHLLWQLALAVAAWIVLTPVALYLVFSDRQEL